MISPTSLGDIIIITSLCSYPVLDPIHLLLQASRHILQIPEVPLMTNLATLCFHVSFSQILLLNTALKLTHVFVNSLVSPGLYYKFS